MRDQNEKHRGSINYDRNMKHKERVTERKKGGGVGTNRKTGKFRKRKQKGEKVNAQWRNEKGYTERKREMMRSGGGLFFIWN